ncbi:DUF4331 domain-containing protein [Myxococcus sp. K15C18031901]|uniref:DUF4331 domain-containing protein n=1 Tax=Myxococcus dinghuensis TaxID=2906761 RepID=UPI0020A7117B|nr:DUF4331 domain-containing protein [Myxococcus dinghuensis]MCP3102306.1 DUF4331 domain-containing protein [Myxococcus dinghuensis]
MSRRQLAGAMALAAALAVPAADASSHREAPFITRMPKVDATDFYMFRSYEAGREDSVTLIANYLPLQDAYGGPNYFSLDPDALYEIHIDNSGDAIEDITFQFRFTNNLNGANGITLPVGPAGNQKNVSVPFTNVGAITFANRGNQNVQENYSVKVVRGARRSGTAQDLTNTAGGSTTFAKPADYVGTKSLGNAAAYESYAQHHIYNVNIPGCTGVGRMFVGQRRESFAVNLGPVFDLVNAPPAVITDPSARGAVPNPLAKKNVTTLALEVPISCLKAGTQSVIGGWTTASVRQARAVNPAATYTTPSREGGAWTQVSRLGMPLVNEVVIGIKDKDRFNASEPKDDAQFADYVTHPTLPAVLELLFGGAGVKAPTVFPRTDLVAAFLTGVTGVNANGSVAEMQRLNTALPATAKSGQNNLGAAACFVNGQLTLGNAGCDPAGFPNGRRPGDDVVDVALRVSMGYLLANDTQAPARNVPFHDAVLQDASQFDAVFPYLTTPNAGANGDGT